MHTRACDVLCIGADELGGPRDGGRGGEQHDRQDVHLPMRQQLLAPVLPWLLAEVSESVMAWFGGGSRAPGWRAGPARSRHRIP